MRLIPLVPEKMVFSELFPGIDKELREESCLWLKVNAFMCMSKFKAMSLPLAVPPCQHGSWYMSSEVENACFQTIFHVTQALSAAYRPKVLAAEYFAILLLHLDDNDHGSEKWWCAFFLHSFLGEGSLSQSGVECARKSTSYCQNFGSLHAATDFRVWASGMACFWIHGASCRVSTASMTSCMLGHMAARILLWSQIGDAVYCDCLWQFIGRFWFCWSKEPFSVCKGMSLHFQ